MKKNLFRLAAVLVVLALFFACSSNTVYYTVSYEPNGGSYVASEQVPSGGKATAPVAPTKSGYTFDGWYEDAEFTIAFDFETKIYKSYKLYAKWTENKPEPQPEPPIPPVPAGDEVTFVARGIETETKAVTADDYFLTFKRDGSANGYIDDKKFTTTWKVTSDGMFIAIDGDDFGVVSTMNPEEEGDELIWSFDELCLCGVIYLRSETGLYSDMNFVNEEVAEVTYSVAFNKGLYGPAGVNNPDTQVVLRGGSAMQPEGGIWDRVVCWQTKDGDE